MKTFFPFQVGLVSFFGRSEGAEIDALAIYTNRGAVVFTVSLSRYAGWQRVVLIAPPVLGILTSCSYPKISPAIVRGDVIDVVDLAGGFLSGHQQPDESMLKEFIGVDAEITIWVAAYFTNARDSAGALTGMSCVPCFADAFGGPKEMFKRPLLPHKLAGVRVVVEALAKIREEWHDFLSHMGLCIGSLVRAALMFEAPVQPACVYAAYIAEMQA